MDNNDCFEGVSKDFEGPILIEVFPEWRSGRGRFYRSGSRGYTNDISQAGVFFPKTFGAYQSERWQRVDAVLALQAGKKELLDKAEQCRKMADSVQETLDIIAVLKEGTNG